MADNVLVVMVTWDREGMPSVQVVTPNESVVDVIQALALAGMAVGKGVVDALAQVTSEVAHYKALLEERDKVPSPVRTDE